MPSRRRLLAGLAALPATAAAQGAAPLGQPQGAPLLTVSGRIGVRNRGSAAVFDMAMVEALGLTGFTTVTPWFDGPVRFDGVPMARLMEAVGATGDVVMATALNDYSTDIPISDFARFGVLLATKRDGQRMKVSEKGPLFIVYPYDSNPDLRARQYYSRSAWSVAQLTVK